MRPVGWIDGEMTLTETRVDAGIVETRICDVKGQNRNTRRDIDRREYRRRDDGRTSEYERPDNRKDFRRTQGEASRSDRRDDFPRDN